MTRRRSVEVTPARTATGKARTLWLLRDPPRIPLEGPYAAAEALYETGRTQGRAQTVTMRLTRIDLDTLRASHLIAQPLISLAVPPGCSIPVSIIHGTPQHRRQACCPGLRHDLCGPQDEDEARPL